MNNNQQPPKKPNDGGYYAFIMLYLTINGFATGRVIHTATDMMNHGYDQDKTIIMLLWLLLVGYSAQRIYEINRDRKNRNNNNNKTR